MLSISLPIFDFIIKNLVNENIFFILNNQKSNPLVKNSRIKQTEYLSI